jgi:hypothetical protein
MQNVSTRSASKRGKLEPYARGFEVCFTLHNSGGERPEEKRLKHYVFSPQCILLNSTLSFNNFNANVNKVVFNLYFQSF